MVLRYVCILCIVWQMMTDESHQNSDLCNVSYHVPKLHCRLINFDPVTPLKSLRANCYGQLTRASVFLLFNLRKVLEVKNNNSTF